MNGHSESGADSAFAAAGAAGGGFFSLHGIVGMLGTFSTKVWPRPLAIQSGRTRSARDRSPIPFPGSSIWVPSRGPAVAGPPPHLHRPPPRAHSSGFGRPRTPPLICADVRNRMMTDILGQSSDRARPNLRNSLPASYARQTVEIAAERGIAPERIIAGTGLSLAMLEAADLRLAASDAARVVRNALECTGDRGLGIEFGLRTTPNAHGFVGFAAMSAGTLREALDLGTRFVHLRQRDTALRVSVQGEHLVLEARENHDLGGLRSFFLEALMVGFYNMAAVLLGEPKPSGELWFDWPA